MFGKYKIFLNKLRSDKRFAVYFISYIGTVTATALIFINWPGFANKTIFVLFLTLLVLVSLFTWSMAALAVFRSLLVVGAGLSLLLFIAQMYCDLPIENQVANDSLQSLIVLGILFIGAIFVVRLYRELYGDPEAKREFDKLGAFKIFREINKGNDPILLLVLYASFMGLILGQIFQVLYPIFNHLCIYN